MSEDKQQRTIPVEDHDAITRTELLVLIDAASRCECGFDCFCSKNLAWAEDKLSALQQGGGK